MLGIRFNTSILQKREKFVLIFRPIFIPNILGIFWESMMVMLMLLLRSANGAGMYDCVRSNRLRRLPSVPFFVSVGN